MFSSSPLVFKIFGGLWSSIFRANFPFLGCSQCIFKGMKDIHYWLLNVLRTHRRWMVWQWVFSWATQISWTMTDSMMPSYRCWRLGLAETSCLVQTGRLLMLQLSSITWPSVGAFWAVCHHLRHSWKGWRCPVIFHGFLMDRSCCTPFVGCHAFPTRPFRSVQMCLVIL